MVSTYTPDLRLTLQATGDNNNTWGTIANAVFSLIEQAVAGYLAVTLSTGAVTLSTVNGGSDQARNATLALIGSISGNCTVVIPNVPKVYILDNQTSGAFTVTVETSAPSASVVLGQGTVTLVYCDGANNVFAAAGNATTLGGLAAVAFAQLGAPTTATTPGTAVPATFINQVSNPFFVQTYGASVALNAANGNSQVVTLTGDIVLGTPTNPLDGQQLELIVVQDAGGGHLTSFNASWIFPNGNNNVDATANGITVISAIYLASISKWICNIPVTGYTTGASVPFAINILQNTLNFNLQAQMGGVPIGSVNVTITVGRGVIVGSLAATVPAMDLSGMPSGSVITLINFGYIQGKGGLGGHGAAASMDSGASGNLTWGAQAGRAGGDALKTSGAGTTTNITNASGFIWGGGGGGGGGGASGNDAGASASGGGGGGGGAGGGWGGEGGTSGIYGVMCGAADGVDAVLGITPTSAFGTGGAFDTQGDANTSAGNGGDGGDWGAAGNAGTAASALTRVRAPGAGGNAGNAINTNSSTVNILSGGGSPNVKGSVV